ncbi:Imm26 family immunity protein [Cohnella sp.]|uniref:Imm26 family immunity protein n=1 Tax=Cohnella sp. TaxID=1883426 RepID=UPI00356B2EF5
MTSIKIQGWEKKPRTTLRGIKVGDIFMLSLGDLTFAAGRILSKTSIGHGAEFFDLLLTRPEFSAADIESSRRACPPVIIDSYWVFDRKLDYDSLQVLIC